LKPTPTVPNPKIPPPNPRGRAPPASFTTRTDSGIAFILPSSVIAEGTVLTSVIFSSPSQFCNASASSAIITFPPQLSGTKISNTERSKQIDVHASTPDNSSSLKTSLAQCINTRGPSCTMATPLGQPGDPEV